MIREPLRFPATFINNTTDKLYISTIEGNTITVEVGGKYEAALVEQFKDDQASDK